MRCTPIWETLSVLPSALKVFFLAECRRPGSHSEQESRGGRVAWASSSISLCLSFLSPKMEIKITSPS